MRQALTAEHRERIRAHGPEAKAIVEAAPARFKQLLDRFREEAQTFGNLPTLFLAPAGPDGSWEHYDGRMRVTDSEGHIIADGLDPARYREFLGEAVERDSYRKTIAILLRIIEA